MDSTIIIVVIGIFALIGVFLILAFRPHQKVNVRQPTAADDAPVADILVHDDMTGAHGRAEENDFIPGAERSSRSFNIPDTPPMREVFTGLPENAPPPSQGKRSSAPGAAGFDQSVGEPQRAPFTPPAGPPADGEIEDVLAGGGPPPSGARRPRPNAPRPGAAGFDQSAGEPQRVPFTPPAGADGEIEDILTGGGPPPSGARRPRPNAPRPGTAGFDRSVGEPQRVPFTPPAGADAEIEDVLTDGEPPAPAPQRKQRPGQS